MEARGAARHPFQGGKKNSAAAQAREKNPPTAQRRRGELAAGEETELQVFPPTRLRKREEEFLPHRERGGRVDITSPACRAGKGKKEKKKKPVGPRIWLMPEKEEPPLPRPRMA